VVAHDQRGLTSTHKDKVNVDLLSFLKS